MREISISHKLHPLRMGKSLAGYAGIAYCLAANKKLAIGSSDIEALYAKMKLMYPDAKLTKCDLLVENE